jgi:membrane-bound lytic murein transglycosylase D
MTTPKDMDFDLHLPKGTAGRFEATVAAIPEEMRVYWRYHRVETGETLNEIARRYHTTAEAIAEANNLEGDTLVNDSKLIIPVAPAKTASLRPAVLSYSKHPVHYTVRKGDTVLSVADDFGVPAEKVRQWNRLKGNALHEGRSLTLFKSAEGAAIGAVSESAGRHHTSATTAARKPERAAHTAAKSNGKGKSGARAAARVHSAKSPKPAAPARAASLRSKKHRPQE